VVLDPQAPTAPVVSLPPAPVPPAVAVPAGTAEATSLAWSAWATKIAQDAAAISDAATALARAVSGLAGNVSATPTVVTRVRNPQAAAARDAAAQALAARAGTGQVAPAAAPAAPAAVAFDAAAAAPAGLVPVAVPAPDPGADAPAAPVIAAPAVAAPEPVADAPATTEPEPAAVSTPADDAAAAAAPSASATADPQDDAVTATAAPADACDPGLPAGYATSAAAMLGWGAPNHTEDFDGALKAWGLYDGAGHGGKGKRTPDAVTVKDGIMTITGDAAGNTDGMAWNSGQKYGRWEGRVKAPVSDPSYHAVMLLWPDAENWPVGGEVDFMEMSDHTRQSTDMFLHYGKDNSQLQGNVKVDATQWHNWAVEWTPTHITTFLDGKQWWTTSKTAALPPGPMHLTLQLDWFPRSGASVQKSQMDVDWVRQYPLSGDTSDAGSATSSKGDGSTGDGSNSAGSKGDASKGDASKGDGAKGDRSKGDGSSGSGSSSGGGSGGGSSRSAATEGFPDAGPAVPGQPITDPAVLKPGLVPAAVAVR
jgi:hypothetical protein